MENVTETKETKPTWMDFWAKSVEVAWGPAMGMQNRSAFWPGLPVPVWNENGNGNGTMKRMQELFNSSMKIWQSVCLGLINPDGLQSLPQTMKNLQDTFLKMQQRELDQLVHKQGEWIDKLEVLQDMGRKAYLRTMR